VFFKPDGTQMYITGTANDKVQMYTLGTRLGCNISNIYIQYICIWHKTPHLQVYFLSPDGTSMFVAGNANDAIYQYTLSTPWDITTSTYTASTFNFSSIEGSVNGITFNSTRY
jgi:sugar lactone lactonase YvrE